MIVYHAFVDELEKIAQGIETQYLGLHAAHALGQGI